MRLVEGKGPKRCLMAIVGEAPGETEELLGEPFVGTAGNILNQKLHMAHILRSDCYITNVVKIRPTHLFAQGLAFRRPTRENDFSILWKGSTPHPYLKECQTALLQELDQLETNIVVALGNSALWALTGHEQIGKWRGTVSQITLPSGRNVKVVGSYHPAAVAREWSLGAVLLIDLKKAKRHSDTVELTYPRRELIVRPGLSDVNAYLDDISKAEKICFDIETTPNGITCIGVGDSPSRAMSIPTTIGYWGSIHTLAQVINKIRQTVRLGQSKIGQNITFDIQYLMRGFDILPSKPWEDTMIKQHSCYLELPKSLAFLASVYTDEPYYKDDLKIWMGGQANDELLWQYNARDCCVTFEVDNALDREMDELEVRHIYDFSMELLEPLLFMMLRGVRVDCERMAWYFEEYSKLLEEKITRFQSIYGPVNPFSPKQVGDLAYKKLGLKPVTVKGKVTTNKKAIEKLAAKAEGLRDVAEIRSERTIISNYLEMDLDRADHRLRCSFNSTGTETRRLSSSESVFGSGRNLQNFPKKIRDIIVADSGKEIDAADLSGAESMVVAYCCDDPRSINVFETPGASIHTLTATQIFQISEEEVKDDKKRCDGEGRETESKYFISKKLRHSAEKLGSWVTVSEQLKCTAAEAKRYLAMFYDFNPNLLKWFNEVRNQLQRTRTINTPCGGKRIFLGRFSEEMVRQAVAYIAQDTVAYVINSGIIKLYKRGCADSRLGIELLLQVHDEIVLQRNIEAKEEVHKLIRECFRHDITLHGRTFFIPIDIKSGKNWRDAK